MEMELEDMSGVIYLGRTISWQSLRESDQSLNGVAVQVWLLEQKLDELDAFIWLICWS